MIYTETHYVFHSIIIQVQPDNTEVNLTSIVPRSLDPGSFSLFRKYVRVV